MQCSIVFNVVNHDYHYHSSITIKPLKAIPSLSPLFLNSTSKNGDAESATIRRIQATIPIPSMPHMAPVGSDLSNLPRSWVTHGYPVHRIVKRNQVTFASSLNSCMAEKVCTAHCHCEDFSQFPITAPQETTDAPINLERSAWRTGKFKNQ